MRIIHLSDLHLDNNRCSLTDLRFGRLVRELSSDRYSSDDILLITGDLIENAEHEGAMIHALNQLGRLSEKFEHILLCPGNHDYGNFWGGTPEHMSRFFHLFGGFLKSSTSIPEDVYHRSDRPCDSPFPVVNEIGELLLIGLDTMEGEFEEEIKGSKGDWDWGAEGRLGQRQTSALERLLGRGELKDKKVVVYLHHHPYRNRLIMNRFRDAKIFNEILGQYGNTNLLLFGHNHKFADMSAEAKKYGAGMALEGGSVKNTCWGKARFRVIDMSGSEPEAEEVRISVLQEWWNLIRCRLS
ncbi:MAG: metallophosphoesterase [Mariprofundaceae bacterium]|nr:metallophosphoesterase [Mariprofundaceae bacterium]